jgi:hypothetical protein
MTSEELRERLITKAGILPGDAGAMAAVLFEAAEPVRRVLAEIEHHKSMVEIYRKEAMFAAKAAYAAVMVSGLVAMFAFFGWLAHRAEEGGRERAQRDMERAAIERIEKRLGELELRRP